MSKNKGFSLVELISSMLIFSVAMTGIVLFSAHNSKSVVKSEREAQLSVQSEKGFEEFRGWMLQLQDATSGNRLMYDSIWETYSEGNIIYQCIDTVKGRVVQNIMKIDSFEYKEDKPYASGSRIWCLVITTDISGTRVDTSRVIISRHR
ncbi:prepilin-type N-terminal cleavage/methylation domain-containing protein [candidate division WOR-3 bacterium]|nr:prepilin-type N-terminal cleavage/methylation domain-containing protein [candidate division WOR-3 bacterium]MCK4528041.1 prepilin-type N-terminal cleavage/methylation domain-containing protein [candidate division WOR-3 bacterium]